MDYDIIMQQHTFLQFSLKLFYFCRMAELVEKETEAWYKMDPDPFDNRHPGMYIIHEYKCVLCLSMVISHEKNL